MKQKLLLFTVLVLLSVPALLPLVKPGFFPTQDFIHVARIYEMDRAVKDLQFPVRWVPDFRYGEPLFEFYAPLPYYLGSAIHSLNFGFLATTKILFGLSFLLSGVAMFLFASQLFGRVGGLIAAAMYVYAPYHSVDVYVRGALSESLALIFFPLIFWAAWRLSRERSRLNVVFLSLSLAGLFLTHNIMTVLFFPFFLGWLAFLWWPGRSFSVLKSFLLATGLGLFLAASFLLPAYFEKDFVQSDKLISGYFDYRGHFVELKQFVVPFWGYGASLWGPEDGMSFQVGVAHWLILVAALAVVFWRRDKKTVLLASFLTAEFLFSLFMQHNKSTPIWLAFPLLAYTQFPWRFLGISIFLVSLLGGSLGVYLQKRWEIFGVLLAAAVVAANVGYFHPESFYFDSVDDHYVSAKVLRIDDKLPKDYLPIWVKSIEDEKITLPHALDGEVKVADFQKRSSSAGFSIQVLKKADVEIPVTYFPGWEVFSDGRLVSQEEPSKRGLIRVRLAEGGHNIKLNFTNTPVRSAGNVISFLAIFSLLLLAFAKKLRLDHD